MLRAEAAVFMPATKEDEGSCAVLEETCSTVAPSPSLTAQCGSPMLSPYWGCEESWAAALYGGYDCTSMPEFSLPDVLPNEKGYSDFASFTRPRAATAPQYIDEFSLEGVEDLQASLAGFLQNISPADPSCQQDGESQVSTSVGAVSPPPGLAPPPGLTLPPGLGFDEVEEGSAPSPLPSGTVTAMLRNIPNKYTQVGLVECLNEAGYRGQLDFIYLPIDFKNKCNVGYCFVNFRTPAACSRFASEYHLCNTRDKLPGFNSKKICEVSAARHQGRAENIRRLQVSAVLPELVANPDWLPALFDEDGKAVDFPLPDQATASRGPRSGFNSQRRKGSA